ncbi:tetratricopeptide repeat protein [Pseudemcibacter aquimaris]|uniref:tetratricopeptide repeat protein n=1 Tax=Pseudemcibacter aquimaris TaxID=2857064 RepID=UPI002010EEA1|nr:hypothetical protein [Pseudemcibacter aquimaris]MCC3861501.1 hypothetical protein [Pseudemcibacter aquimaris]WDU58270.1 hypothetical protein KW060_13850 [Pseudemcibacter aquimaris]
MFKISKTYLITLMAAIFFLAPVPAFAQLFPLSENDWDNPEFVERYLGSYGVDTELSPEISLNESTILSDLLPFIEDDIENGIFYLEPKLKADSSPVLDYMLGQLYLENQQAEEAIPHYNNAIRKFPNFLRAYKNVSIAYMQLENCEGAYPNLNKVLELGQGDGLIYGMLGYCYLKDEKFSQSLSAYIDTADILVSRNNMSMGASRGGSNNIVPSIPRAPNPKANMTIHLFEEKPDGISYDAVTLVKALKSEYQIALNP